MTADEARLKALEALAVSVGALEADGWFASWSEDIRVILIRRSLDVLGLGGEGGAGVREPASPSPESPGDAIALEGDE